MKTLYDNATFRTLLLLLIPLAILLMPASLLPVDGITELQKRVVALFFFAAAFWIFEPIPIYATSILIIVLELILISDSSLVFLQGEGETFGTLLSYREIMATFASPVILLFLGGFFLAAAATKYGLDQNIARVVLNKFGEDPKWVLLGVMSLTALFSMFMSNTATTAMMLAILIPVLKVLPPNDKGRTGFVIAVPVAANLGGMGTPIGTPPNAIALKFMSGAEAITFGEWMAFGVPFVVVMVVLAWLLILFVFPSDLKRMKLTIEGTFSRTPKALLVYITVAITIVLWLLDFIHGMNTYSIALIPVAVFLSTGVMNKEDLKTISWEVLWLVSGGIALGLAIEKTGLASLLISSIPFETLNPYLIIALASFTGFFMANFMSHTASANLLLPLLAVLGTSIPEIEAIGGTKVIVLCATFAISLGMSLPISSPPNALAHATGEFSTKHLAKIGFSTGMIGVVLTFALMIALHFLNFFV